MFKLGPQGQWFYRDGGPVEVSLNEALFALITSIAPMQLKLEQFVTPTAAAAAANRESIVRAAKQTTTEDAPMKANQTTGRCKKQKKKKGEGKKLRWQSTRNTAAGRLMRA